MKKYILYFLTFLAINMIIFGIVVVAYQYLVNIRQDAIINEIATIEEGSDRINLVREAMLQNEDTVGWIKVPNTNINMPVVQSENNDFYLYHNFRRESDQAGWAFADFRNDFPELNKNTIVYGHTFRNSRVVFSDLIRLLNANWFNNDENHYLHFITTQHEYKFRIFSVYTIEPTDDYLRTGFGDEDDYAEFLNLIQGRSLHKFNTEINNSLPIITLSTCNPGQTRLVVHAKLVEG